MQQNLSFINDTKMARTPEQEAAYDKIADLIKKFESNLDEIKKNQNETETRIQFINPFFQALGWDIDNTIRNAPVTQRDVVHEDRVNVEGRMKAPDYSFRIENKRKFFLEAKKPSVYLRMAVQPAFQLRRYGWSAKLGVSVLTDFEEFAVYDCTQKPQSTDEAKICRLKYLTYDQYLENFDWLWDLFSREAVANGSLDKFSKVENRGTETVDTAFLKSLDEWRNLLATNIALRNKQLTEDEINYVVQMTINRIVFLRNCEDRDVEPYGNLRACVQSAKTEGDYFRNLDALFKAADQKYNSGLFDFSKDTLSHKISVSNDTIRTIIEEIYPLKSPYEFSVIGVEILGTAYERFLGKVIRLTDKRKVVVEDKPEVRKAGGVFYTPQYIVEYIVKNTVGKLIENKTPEEIAEITICDPACGSGSFLLGAYDYLLDYHVDWYNNQSKQGKKKYKQSDNPLTPEGKLTAKVKKQILLNNIFGVDLDAQAVEVTKLSLLMKCMEGETQASLSLLYERVLPSLENNIKSGNSLIDFDIYEGEMNIVEKKIKPFNWKAAFPKVFKRGGFDAVIGNPPYVRQELLDINQKKYFAKTFQVHHGTADLYSFFIEKSINILNNNGLYSVIVANKWMKAGYGEPLRKFLLQKKIVELIDFGDLQVFKGATTYPCILTVQNTKVNILETEISQNEHIPEKLKQLAQTFEFLKEATSLPSTVKEALSIDLSNLGNFTQNIQQLYLYKKELNGLFEVLEKTLKEVDVMRMTLVEIINIKSTFVKTLDFKNLVEYVNENHFYIQQNVLNTKSWAFSEKEDKKLLGKLEHEGIPLGSYANLVFRGVLTGLNEAFVIDEKTKNQLILQDAHSADLIKPYVEGKNLKSYQTPSAQKYLIFTKRGTIIDDYPAIKAHLLKYKARLMPKPKNWQGTKWNGRKGGSYQWFEIQDTIFYSPEFEKPKIMYQVFQVKPCFVYDENKLFCNNSIFFIPTEDKYLLAVLNSKLGWFLISQYCTQIQNGFQLIWKYFENVPIKKIDFLNKTEKKQHDEIIKLVDLLLKLNTDLQIEKDKRKKEILQGRIAYSEQRINEIVYELYDLTKEEIAIIEQS